MQGGTKSALRQEGHVRFGRLDEFYKTWPSWRRADASRHRFYKHFPPDGGRAQTKVYANFSAVGS